MGVIVQFDYPSWIALFPQFNYLGPTQVTAYFNLATAFNRNDGGGPVTSPQLQSTLLNLATAHLVQLFAPKADGQAPAPIVGRINSASQGSVSVGAEMPSTPNAAWWNQTPFGAAYWQVSAPFRTMRYLPGPFKPVEPWPVAGSGFIGNTPGWGTTGWMGPGRYW